jgi:hypothetical protein
MEPEKEVTTDVSERIKGLESEINEKTLALSEAGARIAGMETESKAQNEEITVLKNRTEITNGDIATVKGALSEAVKCYRELVIAANPELPVELIGGETVAVLNESLIKAKGLVGRVRQVIEAESAKSRVPAGAPGRTAADINTLSAREKIARGIGRE